MTKDRIGLPRISFDDYKNIRGIQNFHAVHPGKDCYIIVEKDAEIVLDYLLKKKRKEFTEPEELEQVIGVMKGEKNE